MAGSYPERLLIHRVTIQRTTGYFNGIVDLKASDRIYWNSENKYFEVSSLRKSHNRVGRLFSVTADLIYFE